MWLFWGVILVVSGVWGTQAVAENVKLTKKLCRKIVDEAESAKYRTTRSGGPDAGAVIMPADLNPTFKMPQNIQSIGGTIPGSNTTNAPINIGNATTVANNPATGVANSSTTGTASSAAGAANNAATGTANSSAAGVASNYAATVTNNTINAAVSTSSPNLPWGVMTAAPSNGVNGVKDASPEDALPMADQSKPDEILTACREAYPEL